MYEELLHDKDYHLGMYDKIQNYNMNKMNKNQVYKFKNLIIKKIVNLKWSELESDEKNIYQNEAERIRKKRENISINGKMYDDNVTIKLQ